jgi:uncharacterized protein
MNMDTHDRDTKNLSPEILLHIAQTLNVPLRGLVAVIELLDDGGTVPFIARYRKEATGNLDEVQILSIEEKLAYFRDLADRRETILASIAEQGKLTDELKARIEATLDKASSKTSTCPTSPSGAPRPPSPAKRAWSRWPQYLWAQQATDQPLEAFAATFVNAELGVATVGGGSGRRAPHCRRVDQRARRPAQSAAPTALRRGHGRQQARPPTRSMSRKSSRCTTSTRSR